jgi:hypothetical protein
LHNSLIYDKIFIIKFLILFGGASCEKTTEKNILKGMIDEIGRLLLTPEQMKELVYDKLKRSKNRLKNN